MISLALCAGRGDSVSDRDRDMDMDMDRDRDQDQDQGQEGDGFQPISPLDPISPWPPLPTSPSPGRKPTTETSSSHANSTSDLPSGAEIYGLIAVLSTYLAFGTYLVWALCPPRWLDRVGWTWYPSKDWALVIPCYLMLVVLLAYFSYAALSAYLTPPFDSTELITDRYCNIPARDPGEDVYYWKFADPRTIPEAIDLPIDLVNRVLYPPRKRRK